MSPVARCRGFLSRWLFAPAEAGPLGLCRLAFYGLLFLYFVRLDFAAFGGLPDSVFHPISVFRVFRIPVAPPAALDAAQLVWKASLLLAAIGLATRPACWIAFLVGTYLLAVPQNAGRVFHDDALLVFILAALAFSRCGAAWSVDAWLRRRRGGQPAAPSGEHRWPLIFAQVVLSCVFFAAGWAKLRNGGLAWVFSDHMSTVLIKQQYNSDPWVNWGLHVAARPWLASVMAASTLLIELAYPLALASRRVRWIVVPGMAAAQVGIRALMGPAFWPFLICNVFWIPMMVPGGGIRGPWRERG
ncbi:HTTM domain-containing protein [Phycisphaera mikurensis]|uniref:Hypothetical membrane protein n=1 Tax=Phycisphaera mikurensis (strain NBRC 102666 / KCTC 22515 / FYK2301M01) TaxID=1142394 RepID=I0IFT7_PHYMF|nr:HTTM domain-containing protein [Phycisphaera mikurensis]MBB6440486.1 putative membrane protein YphA (DoxX/SURF4 family) [Phycisphaera mikurensis]BAM04125.1 hypothetical membrane protein [Phycisphaera mikurensis NBRC 102666]